MRLFFEHIECGLFERRFLFRTPSATCTFNARAFDLRQNTCRLLATHHGNAGIGPRPKKARRVSTSRHAVITCPERTPDQHCDFRHLSGRNCRDKLCAILRDATCLVFLANHEAGNVL